MPATPHIFGVRHLSPAAAWHLRQLLDRVRPKLVLIEGSDDADELIPHIVSPKSKLPIAILAYTTDAPVRTFCYPLATYSPEYQALLWCQQSKAKARFMDLPSSVFLGLMAWIGWWQMRDVLYFSGIIVAAGLVLLQYRMIRDRTREGCFRAFLHNNWVGCAIFAGLAADLALNLRVLR